MSEIKVDLKAYLKSDGKPSKALIIGSCISYDVLTCAFPNAERRYLWRISTPSLLSNKPGSRFDASALAFTEDESRNFLSDKDKEFELESLLEWADFVALDMYRDTYDLIRNRTGEISTRGPEYDSHKDLEHIVGGERIVFGSSEFWSLLEPSLINLLTILRNSHKPVLLSSVYLSPVYEDGDKLLTFPNLSSYEIRRKNFFLSHYFKIVEGMLPGVVSMSLAPWSDYAWSTHPWGLAPIHFQESSYLASIPLLEEASETSSILRGNLEIEMFRRKLAQASLKILGYTCTNGFG